MTTYFAFKLAEPTQAGMDQLLRNLDAGVPEPQHALHTRVTIELVDETLHHCVEELIDRFQGGESAGVLTTLLGLLKGTAHMLVRQLLGKGDNAEVARMATFIRSRRLELNGQVLYGFALPDDLARRFRYSFAAVARGEGPAHRAELHALMRELSALSLQRFYDDFVAPMELGFIKRKAGDLGRATIAKGVQVAIDKLIPQLGQKELQIFADYLEGLFVDA
jgi:hypothetical protein